MALQSCCVVSTRVIALDGPAVAARTATSVAGSNAAADNLPKMDFDVSVMGCSIEPFEPIIPTIVALIGRKAINLVLDGAGRHCHNQQTAIPETRS